MTAARAEKAALAAAALLLAAGWAARALRGESAAPPAGAVYPPLGLFLLGGLNARLRSKVLAWTVFTASLVLALIVFGAGAVAHRAIAGAPTANFVGAAALYAALAVAAACQLRVSPQGA